MKKKIIIIPDVHGRTLWKKAVEGNEDKTIIFLGDYTDCYYDEIGVTPNSTLENFKEILKFKEEHGENVILLLGNHDLGYVDYNINSCRRDFVNAGEIKELIADYHDFFQLAYEAEINGKRFIFSHAGINANWLEQFSKLGMKCFPDFYDGEGKLVMNKINAGGLNKAWENMGNRDSYNRLLSMLSVMSRYRGGWGNCSSLVWSDVREYMRTETPMLENTIQIFAHTRCAKPSFFPDKNIYMLDAGYGGYCGFYIDESGEIHCLDEGKEIVKIDE